MIISRFEQDHLRQLINRTIDVRGKQYPNPAVGARLIKENTLLYEAFHLVYGQAHAEANVLAMAGEKAQGATLLITLEPCIHYGKTPPCVEAIISSGVCRVVWAIDDPNPLTRKKAKPILAKAGIDVVANAMPVEGMACLPEFYAFYALHRPYVYVKAAVSLDGMIAPNRDELTYISSKESLELVQRLRTWVQAIVVGAETINIDQPRLTIRLNQYRGQQPMIVILDPSNRVDLNWLKQALENGRQIYLFRSAPLDIHHGQLTVDDTLSVDKKKNWKHVLKCLHDINAHGVLVEGGGGIFASILTSGYFDELWITKVPHILGQGGVPFFPKRNPIALNLSLQSTSTLGPDVVSCYKNQHAFSI